MSNSTYNIADAWASLDERNRRKIFRAIEKVDSRAFKNLAERVPGFQAQRIARRPAAAMGAIDRAFLAHNAGKFACYVITRFFSECDTTLNDRFISLFDHYATSHEKATCRQASDHALGELRAQLQYDEMLEFYVAALRAYAKERFSDSVSAGTLVRRVSQERAAQVSAQGPEEAGEENGAMVAADDLANVHSLFGVCATTPHPDGELIAAAAVDDAVVTVEPPASRRSAPISINPTELVAATVAELRNQPAQLTMAAIVDCGMQLRILRKYVADVEACALKVDANLGLLDSMGFAGLRAAASRYAAKSVSLPLREHLDAMYHLVQALDQIADAQRACIELNSGLAVGQELLATRQTYSDIETCVAAVNKQLAAIREAIAGEQRDVNAVLDFVARIEACDYRTAYEYLEQLDIETINKFIDALVRCLEMSAPTADVDSRRRDAVVYACMFVRDEALVSLMGRLAWGREHADLLHLLTRLLESALPSARSVAARILCGLTWDQLLVAAGAGPRCANAVASVCLAALARRRDQELAQWLGTVAVSKGLDQAWSGVLRELARASAHASFGQDLAALMSEASVCTSPEADDIDRRALECLAGQSGYGGNFHRLREAVQRRYIDPVMKLVGESDRTGANALWVNAGGATAIVHRCAQQLQEQHSIGKSHIDKITAYAADFEDLLQSWCFRIDPRAAAPAALVSTVEQLRLSIGGSESVALFSFDEMFSCKPPATLDVPDCALSGAARGDSRPNLAHCTELRSGDVECWIAACEAPGYYIPVAAALAERLLAQFRNATGDGTTERWRAAIDRGRWRAARLMTKVTPDAPAEIVEAVDEARRDFRGAHREVMAAVEAPSASGLPIAEWGAALEAAIDDCDFGAAQEVINVIELELSTSAEMSTGAYSAAVAFLEDAEAPVPRAARLDDLLAAVEKIRSGNTRRRCHIAALEKARMGGVFEERLNAELADLATRLDKPKLWPTEAISSEWGEAIAMLMGFIEAKTRLKTRWPNDVHQMETMIGAFLTRQFFPDGGEPLSSVGLVAVSDFALSATAELWELPEVLAFLAEAGVQGVVDLPKIAVPTSSVALPTYSERVSHSRISQVGERPGLAIARARQHLRLIVGQTPTGAMPINAAKLARDNARDRIWGEASALGAALAIDGDDGGEWPAAVEAFAFGMRLEHIAEGGVAFVGDEVIDLALGICSFAVASDSSAPSYWLDDLGAREHLLTGVLCLLKSGGAPGCGAPSRRKELAAALAAMRDAANIEPNYLRVYELLTRAHGIFDPQTSRRGSAIIADTIWSALTGGDEVARSRTDFLHMAYNMRLEEEIVAHLAATHAKPFNVQIVQYLAALHSANSDEDAWSTATRLAQSFLQQVPKGQFRVWRMLVEERNALRQDLANAAICAVTLENLTKLKCDELLIELCIAPDKYSTIRDAQLTIKAFFDDGANAVNEWSLVGEEDDSMVGATIHRLSMKLPAGAQADDVRSLSYVLTVVNSSGSSSELRGSWPVDAGPIAVEPLASALISRCWPGAGGSPVDSTMKAFHGRVREIGAIDTLIRGSEQGRQSSAVIIGQRRIGKTSVLIETMRQHQPDHGRICALFCNLGGIGKASPDEPLARTVFNALIECGNETNHNEGFCLLMERSLGPKWRRKLRKTAFQGSLKGALDEFVTNVDRATAGQVQRIAFFVDEFQAIFRFPMNEINGVMWDLRPIVQMSPRISLILAGSGLTNSLIKDYEQALFGSVAVIRLMPFDLAAERDAVRDTFMPLEARELCGGSSENTERIVEHAWRLTGGHPWFLAMLGHAAAAVLQGRTFTVPLLNEVVRRMMTGDGSGLSVGGAERFYGHLLDALNVVNDRRWHAQLVLANVARQVTAEWPYLTPEQAINGPMIAKAGLTRGNCVDALNLLVDEDILARDLRNGGNYRIKIPMVAEAVRYDAMELEYRALDRLGTS